MVPDKIYLAYEYSEIDTLPPGVTSKQVFDKDVCYIRKDALLEWINEMREKHRGFTDTELVVTLDKLTEKINSF